MNFIGIFNYENHPQAKICGWKILSEEEVKELIEYYKGLPKIELILSSKETVIRFESFDAMMKNVEFIPLFNGRDEIITSIFDASNFGEFPL